MRCGDKGGAGSMNKPVRFVLVIFSFLLAIMSMILLYSFVRMQILSDLDKALQNIIVDPLFKWILLSVLLCIIASAVWAVSYSLLSGRLSKTRIRQTDIGFVDIGVDAIESIALNSAKSAQVGIKSAKAHVSSGKDESIRIHLVAVLYSNVEVPAMMSKVQDRIKKDLERYTGIPVESVSVKVSRVEPIVAKVER
jgi:Asp23 family, cell envelope-related function